MTRAITSLRRNSGSGARLTFSRLVARAALLRLDAAASGAFFSASAFSTPFFSAVFFSVVSVLMPLLRLMVVCGYTRLYHGWPLP